MDKDKSRDLILSKLRNDRIWAYLELKNDIAFPYMTNDDKKLYIDGALELGFEQAQPYKERDLVSVIKDAGVKICSEDLGTKIRAAYSQNCITINPLALEQMANKLSYLPFSYSQFEKASIAHEFFHHLEETALGPIDHHFPPVTTIRLGVFWSRQRRVRSVREIAAHRFAKELVNLPCLPNVFDWLIFTQNAPDFHNQLPDIVTSIEKITDTV